MSKHTKGPWSYAANDTMETGYTIRTHGFGWVANCGKFHTPKGHHNAQRIVDCVNALDGFADPSAAPDLLEAAKAAVIYMKSLRATPSLGNVIENLEFAISKAEGK